MKVFLWAKSNRAEARFNNQIHRSLNKLSFEFIREVDLSAALSTIARIATEDFVLFVDLDSGFQDNWLQQAEKLIPSIPTSNWALVAAQGFSPLVGALDATSYTNSQNPMALPLSNFEGTLLLVNVGLIRNLELPSNITREAQTAVLSVSLIQAGFSIFWAEGFGTGILPIKRSESPIAVRDADNAWLASRTRSTLIRSARRDIVISHVPWADPLGTDFDLEAAALAVACGAGKQRTLRIAQVFREKPSQIEAKRLRITNGAFEALTSNVEVRVLTPAEFNQTNSQFDWVIFMPESSWLMPQAAQAVGRALRSGDGYEAVEFSAIRMERLLDQSTLGRVTDQKFTHPSSEPNPITLWRVGSLKDGSDQAAMRAVTFRTPLIITPTPVPEPSQQLEVIAPSRALNVVRISSSVSGVNALKALLQRSYRLLSDQNSYRKQLRLVSISDLRRLYNGGVVLGKRRRKEKTNRGHS
jgi:hypothetical protein